MSSVFLPPRFPLSVFVGFFATKKDDYTSMTFRHAKRKTLEL